MIRSFRNRGLQMLYANGDRRRLPADAADKIARILARLDQADGPSCLDVPGYRLHPLKCDLAGYWAISISGNWRIIFRFVDGDAVDVDLVDYH